MFFEFDIPTLNFEVTSKSLNYSKLELKLHFRVINLSLLKSIFRFLNKFVMGDSGNDLFSLSMLICLQFSTY